MVRPNPELPDININDRESSSDALTELKQRVSQGSPIESSEGSQQSEALKETRVNLRENSEEVRAAARDLLIENQALVNHLRGTANLYADFQAITKTFQDQLNIFNGSMQTEMDVDNINAAKDIYVEAIKGLVEQAIFLQYKQRQAQVKQNQEKNKQAAQEELIARREYKRKKRRHTLLTKKIARLNAAIPKATSRRKTDLETQLSNAQNELDTINLTTLENTHQQSHVELTQSSVNLAVSKIERRNDYRNLHKVRNNNTDLKQLGNSTLNADIQNTYNTQRGQNLRDKNNSRAYSLAKSAWRKELARHKKDLLKFQNNTNFDDFLKLEIADVETSTSHIELKDQAEFNSLVAQINQILSEEEKVQAQNAQIAANALLNSSTREIRMQEGAISETPTEELTTPEGNIDFGLAVFGSITVPRNSDQFPNGLATRRIDTKGTRRNLTDDELINDSKTYNLKPGDAITIDFLREPTTLKSSIGGTTHMYARIRTINGYLVRGKGLYVSTRHLEQLIHKADYQESLQTIEQDSIENANRFVHEAETELSQVLLTDPSETATPFNNALNALTAADISLDDQLEHLEAYKTRLESQNNNAEQTIPQIVASQQKVRQYQTKLTEFRDRIQRRYNDTIAAHQSGQNILDTQIRNGVIENANQALTAQATTLSQLEESLATANQKTQALDARLDQIENLIDFRDKILNNEIPATSDLKEGLNQQYETITEQHFNTICEDLDISMDTVENFYDNLTAANHLFDRFNVNLKTDIHLTMFELQLDGSGSESSFKLVAGLQNQYNNLISRHTDDIDKDEATVLLTDHTDKFNEETIQILQDRLNSLVAQEVADQMVTLKTTYEGSLNGSETNLSFYSAQLEQSIDNVENQIAQLDSFITFLAKAHGNLNTGIRDLNAEKRALNTYLRGLQGVQANLQRGVDIPETLTEEITRLEGRSTELQQAIDAAEQRLREINEKLPLARKCKELKEFGFPKLQIQNPTPDQVMALANAANSVTQSTIELNGVTINLDNIEKYPIDTDYPLVITENEIDIAWNDYGYATRLHIGKNASGNWIRQSDSHEENEGDTPYVTYE